MNESRIDGRRACSAVAAVLTILGIVASDAASQGNTPFYRLTGASADAKFGAYVARVPDADGDGADEIVAGSHRFDGVNGKDSGRVQLFSGATGKLLWTVDGERADGLLGHNCWGIRDVTGDGRGDVIVSAYRFDSTGRTDNGKVYLLSGADGSIQWTAEGQASSDEFGYALSDVPDLNGDGVDDVLVGAWNNDASAYLAGRVYVYSGKDGTLIRSHGGVAQFARLGAAVAGLADIDGDSRGDYVIAARDGGTNAEGEIFAISGATGSTLWTRTGQFANDQFGWNTTRLDDVDGDGYDDLFVGAPDFDLGAAVGIGRGYVYSGRFGTQLYTIDGQVAGDHFGRFAAGVPDTDGDGRGDLCVGAFNHAASNGNLGAAYLYSGRTGTLRRQYAGESRFSYFGFAMCGLNDVNDDGRGDVCVGAYQWMANPPANPPIFQSQGRIYVFVEETLTGSASSLSVSQGGQVTFQIDAGAQHAGRTYQLLCTVNGYLPGLNFGSMHLPLNPSDVLFLSFKIANSSVLQNSLRVLDANGRGTASFNAWPGMLAGQGNAGINLRFAYFMVVRLDHTSNMWRVGLTP